MHARRTGQIDLFTRRVRRPPPALEFATGCMVADALRRWAAPGWIFTHIPLGEHRSKAAAGRLQRLGTRPGWADLILISPAGRPHFLELKRARTGRLNDAQQEFATWCKEHGVPFAIARDFSEALRQLQLWGAVRTGITVSA